MPKFGDNSKRNLATCHGDLQTIFNKVVETFDCTVVYGHRDVKLQQELFQRGRRLSRGEWIIENRVQVITYCDGVNKKSYHNYSPALAADVVPYPIDWSDMNRMRYFVGYVKGIAQMLKEEGKITHTLVSGMDWDNDTDLNDQRFLDIPHFQLK